MQISNINIITKHILQGSVIALPTDTICGIVCNAHNAQSINKIYKIKKRSVSKPIAIITHDIDHIRKIICINNIQARIINHLHKIPITYIFKSSSNNNLSKQINYHGKTAIRISHHPIIKQILLRNKKLLIAATSANVSSKIHANYPRNIAMQNVHKALYKPQYKISKQESTIVDLSNEINIKIARMGYMHEKIVNILANQRIL